MATFELQPYPAFDTAPTIALIEGEIVLVGPGAMAFSMTRIAAEETYRRLGAVLFGEATEASASG
ncbi:hypothetical protein [Caulobacter segnis]